MKSYKMHNVPATDACWQRFKAFCVGHGGLQAGFEALVGLTEGNQVIGCLEKTSEPGKVPEVKASVPVGAAPPADIDRYFKALDRQIEAKDEVPAPVVPDAVDGQFGAQGLGRPVDPDAEVEPVEYLLKAPPNISLKQVGDSYAPFTTFGDGIWRGHDGEVVSDKDSKALDKLARSKGYELIPKAAANN